MLSKLLQNAAHRTWFVRDIHRINWGQFKANVLLLQGLGRKLYVIDNQSQDAIFGFVVDAVGKYVDSPIGQCLENLSRRTVAILNVDGELVDNHEIVC